MQKPTMNFDYLRLFLAVTVMTGHVGLPFLQLGPLWNNEMAVLGFFCISGFLIAQSFLRSDDIGSYVKNRFARIYPPIAAVVVIMTGFGLVMIPVGAQGFDQAYFRSVFSLALFQDWLVLAGEGHKIFAHGAFWTLVVEAQFYIALPFAIVAWRKWPVRTLAALIAVYFASHFSRRYMENDILLLAFRDNLFTVAHFFIAGMIAAMYGKKVFASRWFWPVIVPASAIIYAFLQLRGNQYVTHLMPFAIMAMIYAIASLSGRFGNRRDAKWGDISYGVYIYHFPVLFILGQLDPFTDINLQTPNKIAAVTVLISFASWWWLERPILQAAKGSANRVFNADGQVRPSPKVGGKVFQSPVVRTENVEGVGPLNDAAKAGGSA